ncbi:hypothetical protein E2C01_013316 [Portunus trituberculatus]|uniref:Uncharacterized protein n=1 Tax=Portunus trituberculatus TaxID=210409 RepID=A0A5B7DGP4_PORTR|nr:hypothetical protein [Portunus trituberculatus]
MYRQEVKNHQHYYHHYHHRQPVSLVNGAKVKLSHDEECHGIQVTAGVHRGGLRCNVCHEARNEDEEGKC